MMFKQGITISAFVGAALLATSVTNADTVRQVIGIGGSGDKLARDASREDLYNGPGEDGVYGTSDDVLDSDGVIDEGDVIHGILDFADIEDVGNRGAAIRIGSNTDNNELTGQFAIRVASKSADGEAGDSNFVFEPAPAFSNGEGTVIRLYEDSNNNFSPDGGTKAEGVDTAIDGDLFLEIGFDGDPDLFFSGSGNEDITTGSGQLSGNQIAHSNFLLNRTTNNGIGGDLDLVDLTSDLVPGATGEFSGSSDIFAGNAGSPFRIIDETNVNFSVIPTPTAGMAGVAMLGLMGLVRRRRRA